MAAHKEALDYTGQPGSGATWLEFPSPNDCGSIMTSQASNELVSISPLPEGPRRPMVRAHAFPLNRIHPFAEFMAVPSHAMFLIVSAGQDL